MKRTSIRGRRGPDQVHTPPHAVRLALETHGSRFELKLPAPHTDARSPRPPSFGLGFAPEGDAGRLRICPSTPPPPSSTRPHHPTR